MTPLSNQSVAYDQLNKSFSKKDLSFIFTMANKNFDNTSDNSIELTGLRASVDYISQGQSYSSVTCKIFGISLNVMNQLTTLQGDITTQYQNSIDIYTIDGGIRNKLFTGTIYSSWGSFENMPDVYMYVQASPTYEQKIKPSSVRSYSTSVSIDDVVQTIASEFGKPYFNNGVSVICPAGLYLSGSLVDQLDKLADAFSFYWSVENGTLNIFPRNGSIPTSIRVISDKTGMIGYPSFDNATSTVSAIYVPNTYWGTQVNIISDLPRANGIKTIIGLSHRLTSNIPNGDWFSTFRCSNIVSPVGQIS